MTGILLAAASCFILGIITTIHPCPLTTNIAAVSLLSGWTSKYQKSIYPFVLFITGYVAVFIVIAILISGGVYIRSSVSMNLQNSMQLFIGPVLILVGMVLADLLHLNRFYSGRIFAWLKKKRWRGVYALPMGALLALSFCPATAAVFFGILVPLTIQHDQIIVFPLIYSLGATLPLIAIVVMIMKGGRLFLNKKWQKVIPLIAGWIIICIGIYITIQRILL